MIKSVMSGIDVQKEKCIGPINSSVPGGVEVVYEEGVEYSGLFTGVVDKNRRVLEIIGCDALNECGKCITDGVDCPVARVLVTC